MITIICNEIRARAVGNPQYVIEMRLLIHQLHNPNHPLSRNQRDIVCSVEMGMMIMCKQDLRNKWIVVSFHSTLCLYKCVKSTNSLNQVPRPSTEGGFLTDSHSSLSSLILLVMLPLPPSPQHNNNLPTSQARGLFQIKHRDLLPQTEQDKQGKGNHHRWDFSQLNSLSTQTPNYIFIRNV